MNPVVEALETTMELNDATSALASSASDTASTDNTIRDSLLTPVFTDLAAALCENQDPQKVLAGVLSIVYGDQLSPKHYGKINTKSAAPRGDQKRIFVSLGKRDGYRAKEIAEYFSELLHIPGRLVDDIDVAQQFSLLSLPVASARKAIEMSKSNRKLPHMHFDDKEEGRGPRKPHKDDFGGERDNGGRRERRGSRDGGKAFRDHESPRGRLKAKGNKPNVHAATERSSSRKSGGAAAYKKGSKKAERF